MTRQLFLSCAHKDRPNYDDTMAHLSPKVAAIYWNIWTDEQLPEDLGPSEGAGARALIEPELRESQAFPALVGTNSATSRFIEEIEAVGIGVYEKLFNAEIYILNLDGTKLDCTHRLAQFEIKVTGNYRALSKDEREEKIIHLAELMDTLSILYGGGTG